MGANDILDRVEPFTGMAEQIQQIAPKELAEPLERLFLRLSEIRTVRASFGKECLNVRVVVEQLEKDAEAIERACKELWRDL